MRFLADVDAGLMHDQSTTTQSRLPSFVRSRVWTTSRVTFICTSMALPRLASAPTPRTARRARVPGPSSSRLSRQGDGPDVSERDWFAREDGSEECGATERAEVETTGPAQNRSRRGPRGQLRLYDSGL